MKRSVVVLFAAATAWAAGCASSSSSLTGGQDGGSDGGAANCGPSELRRYDGSSCSVATVTGLCLRDLGYNSATLEPVCVVSPDGTLYVVDVNGDTYLSGDGWTFGPRSLSSTEGTGPYPLEPDTLSPADKTRCQSAQVVCSDSTGDGGNYRDAS